MLVTVYNIYSILVVQLNLIIMKKIIFKSLTFIFVLSLVWSCSTENDVQVQSTVLNGDLKKDKPLTDVEIAEDLGGGVYQLKVNENDLLTELERLALEDDGLTVDFDNIQIVNKPIANDASSSIVLILAGGNLPGGNLVTMSFPLIQTSGMGYTLAHPQATGDGKGRRIACRGCGTGCFIEYYLIDGHYVPTCDPAGCGSNCERMKD